MFRWLVRAVDAGKVLELAGPCLGIKSFDIALLRFGERRIDENLEELPFRDHPANHVALSPERRNEGGEHNQARVSHQSRHFADAADVFDPVRFGEAEVAIEAVADVVAVEQEGVAAARRKLLFNQVRYG